MSSASMPAPFRAVLAASLVGLLSLGSCDLAGDDGGPGSSPGISGALPPGPLPVPFTLENLRANPGIAALESNNLSLSPSLSANGRYVAFLSRATNLVGGVNDGRQHVFVRDMVTQRTSLVSTASDNTTIANQDSQDPFISDDGRYVVFATFASNLDSVQTDNNGLWDIYQRDRVGADGLFEEDPADSDDATTIRVSLVHGGVVSANGHSFRPTISNDGLRIAFQSGASNLVPFADTNSGEDIFVRVLPSTTVRVSSISGTGNPANGGSFNSSISGNGLFVSFMSYATNHTASITNGYYNIFRATVSATPAVDRVSIGLGGAQPIDYCYSNYFQGGGRGISGDGSRVVYATAANNIVPNDTNGNWDLFVRNYTTGVTTRILSSSGEQGNGFTFDGRFSFDGNRVAFLSSATNFGHDFSSNQDIFVKNLLTGALTLVTVNSAGAASPNYFHEAPVLSSDGTVAAFFSQATDLVDNDNNGQQDVFLHALANGVFGAGETHRGSVPSIGSEANDESSVAFIASTGPVVAFESVATNLVADDLNNSSDIFVSDAISKKVRLVSKNSGGTPGDGNSQNPSCSSTGRFVAFESVSTNFVDTDGNGTFDEDTNGVRDIFVHDLVSGLTTRVSVATGGAQSDADCFDPFISGDGRFVSFMSAATTLDPVATGAALQIFVHDRQTATTSCVSVSNDAVPVEGNSDSFSAALSADGRFVAFTSVSTNLDPVATAAGVAQVFVRDRQGAGVTSCASVANGVAGDNSSFTPSISSDGRFVAFASVASNLDPAATGADVQLFVRDRQGAGSTACVSIDALGAEGDADSTNPFISGDGRFVAFQSFASNLDPAATGANEQVFVRDRQGAGSTACISIDDLGAEGDGPSTGPTISADGRWAAFTSDAENLVVPDDGANFDIFLRGPLY